MSIQNLSQTRRVIKSKTSTSKPRPATLKKVQKADRLLASDPKMPIKKACEIAKVSVPTYQKYRHFVKDTVSAPSASNLPAGLPIDLASVADAIDELDTQDAEEDESLEGEPETPIAPQKASPRRAPKKAPAPHWVKYPPYNKLGVSDIIPENFALLTAMMDSSLDLGHPALLWGRPGLGKSSFVEGWCKARNLSFCKTDMSGKGADSFEIPVPLDENTIVKRKKWYENNGLEFTPDVAAFERGLMSHSMSIPDNMRLAIYDALEGKTEGVCMFFDEMTAARADGIEKLKTLLSDRFLGTTQIPNRDQLKLAMVAATNTLEDTAIGEVLSTSMRSRLCHIEYSDFYLTMNEKDRLAGHGWPYPRKLSPSKTAWDRNSANFGYISSLVNEFHADYANEGYCEAHPDSSNYKPLGNPSVKSIEDLNNKDDKRRQDRGFLTQRTWDKTKEQLAYCMEYESPALFKNVALGWMNHSRGTKFANYVNNRPKVRPMDAISAYSGYKKENRVQYNIKREDEANLFFGSLIHQMNTLHNNGTLHPNHVGAVCDIFANWKSATKVNEASVISGKAHQFAAWLEANGEKYKTKIISSSPKTLPKAGTPPRSNFAKLWSFLQNFEQERHLVKGVINSDNTFFS